MSNESGLSPYAAGSFTDTGTGAVDGPPASVTVESPPEHLSEPTGAFPNPPPSVTTYAWPGVDPATEPSAPTKEDAVTPTAPEPKPEAKAITEADNKAVTAADVKAPTGAKSAKKRAH